MSPLIHHDAQHHDAHHHDAQGLVAAWIDGRPLTAAEVNGELDRVRSGTRAALLPVAESAEGRQLRRWVAQTLVTCQLLESEGRRRQLGPDDDPGVGAIVPDRVAAMALGGVLASVLQRSGTARAVFADITACIVPDEHEVADYLTRSTLPGRTPDPRTARERLTEGARRQAFLDWLVEQAATRIRLEPGYEHPGDPHQPDATHRH